MIREFVKAVVGSLATLIIAATGPCSSYSGESPFLLSKDHDTVFRYDGTTWTAYFHFGNDGKYRRITRHHVGITEDDRGTWKQNATGQIEVRSSKRAKTVVRSGPFHISARRHRRTRRFASLGEGHWQVPGSR